jgi:glucose/mannose transport system substrate-binding protein
MKYCMIFLFCVFIVAGILFAEGPGKGGAGTGGEVEVLHWLTDSKGGAAIAVLKQLLQDEGYTWKDFNSNGRSGNEVMKALLRRAVAGNPPAAAQVKGPQIQLWAEEGYLTNLDHVAHAEGWGRLLPKVVADMMKYEGNYVAVPVYMHRINWMWCNPAVFKKAGAEIPRTWEEFEAAAEKIKNAGFIPVAWGGQPWQEATVFEMIVAGIGGSDFYWEAMVDADPEALRSPLMIKALEILKMIKQYIDPDAPGRAWNLAADMVIRGEAAMHFSGDWNKGEFEDAGKEANVDYIVTYAPQTSAQFIFTVDSFIMYEIDPKNKEAQKAMARIIMRTQFQEVFNKKQGSIPVRIEMSVDPFDEMTRLSMKDYISCAQTGDLLPSMAHEVAVMPGVREIILDVITTFFNSDMEAEEAAELLAFRVRNYWLSILNTSQV